MDTPAEMTGKPTPDPTVLTTEQLLREIDRVTALLDSRLDGSIGRIDERFTSVETQFTLIERQRVEQKEDTKAAVDAALAAAKEAVKEQTAASEKSITKSETATGEQLKQLTATFAAGTTGVERQIADLKTRVERIENLKQGGKDTIAAVYALAGFLVALVILGGFLAANGAFGGAG